MRRKQTALLAIGVFIVMLISGTGIGYSQDRTAFPEGRTVTIVFSNGLPDNFEEMVAVAGGRVLRELPEIGGLEASFQHEESIAGFLKSEKVLAVNEELLWARPAGPDAQEDDLGSVRDEDGYWAAQWDMQRIMSGIAPKPDNGKVVGIIDSGMDVERADLRAKLLGGKNIVPIGQDSSEKGDAADIRDREGHGTITAGKVLGSLANHDTETYLRIYRIYAEKGGTPTMRIAEAVVQAAHDDVDFILLAVGEQEPKLQPGGNAAAAFPNADQLLFRRAVSYALNLGIKVNATVGNDNVQMSDLQEADRFWHRYWE